MFYQGDLQSGIGKAVQESKLVACFVTDEGEESNQWENDFLQDETLSSLLSDQTVLLRLIAGSQEAGYLAAIFPLPKTPTIVVIQNGDLKEYLASGVTKEEFLRRLGAVFLSRASAPVHNPIHPDPSPSTGIDRTIAIPPTEEQVVAESPVNQDSETASSAPTTEEQSRVVQDLLAERSARLEVHKKEQDAKDKARRAAEAKARKEALEENTPAGSQKSSADMKYALMQKKRQQDAREERARILKRVEDDKAERREREARRKAQAKTKEDAEQEGTAAAASSSSSIRPPPSRDSSQCALQIRLFDGSTIRSRFPSKGSLRADVRPWIDEQQSGDTPYTFKHVLTPLPNKNISISDEEQSLYSQGLTPSATLILVPVQGYTSAYADGASAGLLYRVGSAGYGLVSGGLGMVTGVLGTFLGAGATPAAPERQHDSASTNSPNPTINVRSLRDQNRPDDQQFYNGNALNFEPRKDDEDKKES